MEPQEILQVASDGLQARLTGQWVHDKKYYLERYLDTVTEASVLSGMDAFLTSICFLDLVKVLFEAPKRKLMDHRSSR